MGSVSTSRQRIAALARQALGMAMAIAWSPGPAGTRRRVAKPSVEEPDAAEPARSDLWEPGSATTLVYPTVDRHEDFIQEPRISKSTLSSLQLPSVIGAALPARRANGFV